MEQAFGDRDRVDLLWVLGGAAAEIEKIIDAHAGEDLAMRAEVEVVERGGFQARELGVVIVNRD